MQANEGRPDVLDDLQSCTMHEAMMKMKMKINKVIPVIH